MNSFSALSEIFKRELFAFDTIGILGFGREGKSTLSAIQKYCPEKRVILADRNSEALRFDNSEMPFQTQCIGGDHYLDVLNMVDVIFVSPGVSLIGHPLPEKLVITSQTDFIFRVFGEKITAITGTKGKSTTAALTTHMLKQHFVSVPLAGNIGIPPFDVLDELIAAQVAVFEVSSHQLQHISSAPRVAILLNLFPEHLDYYPDTETYFEAKKRIFLYQREEDCIVLNNDEPMVYDAGLLTNAKVFHYSLMFHDKAGAYVTDDQLFLRNNIDGSICGVSEIKLKGTHNLSNCLAAVCACSFFGVTMPEMAQGLCTFTGLPHRMEKILSADGKIFYNDSIATVPEATLAAVEALKPVSTLILGGMDRGLPYHDFLHNLLQYDLKNVFFYGEAGLRMFEVFRVISESVSAEYFIDFSDCVTEASARTNPGEICLLSPAASSYDQFRNFEERGDAFIQLVVKTDKTMK
jgi:UDP-N-acetylmuramoyl-L-alanine---L-glutamate ligase